MKERFENLLVCKVLPMYNEAIEEDSGEHTVFMAEEGEHMEADDKRIGSEEPIALSSSKSTRVSLDAVKHGKANLNKHRQSLLERVPEQNQWAVFAYGTLEIMDLAYLTAKTGDEFTILRSKNNDILFHGTQTKCDVLKDKELEPLVMSHKYEVIGHSHPGEPFPDP